MAIKFIYFDVGGVLIRDFSKTTKWKELEKELGVKEEDSLSFIERFLPLELEVCVGRDIETLIPIFQKEFGVTVPEDYSLLDAFVKRFERKDSLLELVKSLKPKYKLGLFTNMYPNMLNRIHESALMDPFQWDAIVDSSVEKLMKPDSEIYELAEKRANVKPEEIFFVDNSAKHVDAALKRSWQTLLYDPANIEKSNNELRKLVL